MTRVISATVLSAFLLVSAAAAQTPAPPTPAPAPAPAAQAPAPFPADARIGFVNLQSVVQNSRLGQAGQERLKTLTDQKSTEIGAKNKEIQTLQQEIQSGQNVLSAAVLSQKTTELDRKNRELQFLQEQAQVDVDALQNQLLEEFGNKVLPIVEQIRAERNLWAVFTTGDGSGLAAINSALEISAEVVRRLDTVE
jgi:outer membrane protein